MRTQDRLFRQTLYAVLPLLIWAAHFAFCYVYAAEACQRGDPGAAVLLAASLAAASASAALLVIAARRGAPVDGMMRLLHWATLVVAALGLIAILWGSVPIVMLPCGGQV